MFQHFMYYVLYFLTIPPREPPTHTQVQPTIIERHLIRWVLVPLFKAAGKIRRTQMTWFKRRLTSASPPPPGAAAGEGGGGAAVRGAGAPVRCPAAGPRGGARPGTPPPCRPDCNCHPPIQKNALAE